MYDPNTYHEVSVAISGGVAVARFDPTDDNGKINVFWDDDLAEVDHALLTTDDKALILNAVGVELMRLNAESVAAKSLIIQ